MILGGLEHTLVYRDNRSAKKSAASGGELAEGRAVTPSRPGTKTAGSSWSLVPPI